MNFVIGFYLLKKFGLEYTKIYFGSFKQSLKHQNFDFKTNLKKKKIINGI